MVLAMGPVLQPGSVPRTNIPELPETSVVSSWDDILLEIKKGFYKKRGV
jgi:hypothetical protein